MARELKAGLSAARPTGDTIDPIGVDVILFIDEPGGPRDPQSFMRDMNVEEIREWNKMNRRPRFV